MDYLASKYALKKGSVKEPDAYLGAEVNAWKTDGVDNLTKVRWSMSSDLNVNTISYLIIREPQSVRQTFSTFQL